MNYPNLFKSHYPLLKGKDWVRTIEPDDRKVFIELGMKHSDFGRLGGKVRAATCKRDNRGRFAKGEK